MLHRAGLGLLIVGVALSGACDRDDSMPPSLITVQPEQETPTPSLPRPTTQALLEGPRTPIVLDTLPISMLVPPQWRITRHSANVVWVEGPTPHSEARIALKSQPSIPHDQFQMYLKGSRRDQEEEKNTTIKIRQAGPMHIVERRTFLQPMRAPVVDSQGIAKLDERGDVVMLTTVPLRWWVHLFVPFEQHVEQYDLSFVDIAKDQFEVDQAFLEKMLSTLQYIGPQPTTAPADPSTLPTSR